MKLSIMLLFCILTLACAEEKEEPVTKSGLNREQAMKLAEKNLKGEVSDSELRENGITVTEVKGVDAKEMLIQEIEALEEEEQTNADDENN